MSDSDFADNYTKIPRHLAMIMDGNGRWARRRGQSVSSGHRAGVETVRRVLRMALDFDIKVVTLFAFSSENWQRPSGEVKALMTLFSSYLKKEVQQLHRDGVCIRFIGDRQRFNRSLLQQMDETERLTRDNDRATLVLAVDYGGQWDIADAARRLAEKVKAGELEPAQIDAAMLDAHISMADLPKPDLCIRTAGEQRISNFLLWQLAYAELFFTQTLWPDFGEADMRAALDSFNRRERRFGARLEQEEAASTRIAGGS